MLRRLLPVLVVVAAIAGFAVLRRAPQHRIPVVVTEVRPTFGQCVREQDRMTPRPLPDVRFLDALATIERVVAGRAVERPSCRFENGGWTIQSGARLVGHVPEFPAYEELAGLAVDCARALGAPELLRAAETDVDPGTLAARRRGHAAIEGAIASLHAVQAAGLADRMWSAGHRDAATARLGARALAWMTLQCFDEAGAGDAVGARAIAWYAITTACDSNATRREAALLARALGYPAGAAAAAARLAANDPIRLAALWNDEVLEAIASRGTSNGDAGSVREARWLALTRAVERRDLESWSVASTRGLDADPVLAMPLLASQLALGRFETNVSAGRALMLAVASDLELNGGATAPVAASEERTFAESMEMFETLLESLPESADGVFLDREVRRGWYRAAFYSSLMGIGEHLRRVLSSTEAVREFSQSLGSGEAGPAVAREFARWYANLAATKADGKRRPAMQEDIAGMPHFGAVPRLRSFEAICDRSSIPDGLVVQCARELGRRVDTRPRQLDGWGRVVMFQLYDLARGEALMRAAVLASHPRDLGMRGWWAAYAGDRRSLERMLADPGHRPEEVSALVSALRQMTPEDSVRLDAVSERLVGERPDEWRILGPYVRNLESRHRTERVRELCGAWLSRPDRSTRALEDVDARNRMARACMDEGRYEEGYRAIQSVIGSWQLTAMTLGAELLDRRGEPAEAETLAMLAWQRYPDSDVSQSAVIEMLWRHGKHDLAARTLREAEPALSQPGWMFELGPRYARLQIERPKEAAKALDALFRAGLGDWNRVGKLVPALAAAGRGKEVADLAARIAPDGRFDAQSAIATYVHTRSALGPEAARDWLQRQLPIRDPQQARLLHMYGYREHHPEVTWQLPLDKEMNGKAEYLWLLRAASAVRDSDADPARRAEIETAFAVPSPSPYRHFGRMLLGLEPVDSVYALVLDPRGQSEAHYYIGLHHQAAGNIAAAAASYARCVDIGFRQNAEHHWALEQLTTWVNRERSIERLTREAGKRAGGVVATGI